MATDIADGWQSLSSGQYDDARRAFQNAAQSDSSDVATHAHVGLAATSLANDDLRDALSFVEEALQRGHDPEAHLLRGEIHSRLANRRDAEQDLDDYFNMGGDAPYALALRGEQRIRTARWDEGISDYLNALEHDDDNRAWRQLQRVLTDLTDAVGHGNLPKKPAEQFVNQIDYKLANPPSGAQSFFGSVRRALDSGTALSGPDGRDPILELLAELDAPSSGGGGARRQRSSRPPETSRPSPGGSTTSDSTGTSGTTETDDASSEPDKGIAPKKKDLAVVIQQDRSKNEQLQDAIGSMMPPDWPSSEDYGEIDPVESLAWENQSIYVDEPGMDSTDFRITSGSVRAEIFLERCLQNLVAGAKQDRAVSVRFRPEVITRIEVNCWDGLLDRIPDISPIYDELHEEGTYQQLALGRFIGECVAAPYDGTWDYAEPPEESKLIIGNETLDPLGLAGDWTRASNPDDVELEILADQADTASDKSLAMTLDQDFIDPTRELEGQSLSVKLAEMWTQYLFRLQNASFPKLAERLEPLTIHEGAIVFEIDRELAPEPAQGPNGSAMLEGDRVPLSYLRDGGEFLLMASRKHAARTAQAIFGRIDRDTAGDIVTFLATYHRPGWTWVRNSDDAAKISSQTDVSVQAPQLNLSNPPTLQVDAFSPDSGLVTLQLVAPTRTKRWRLERR